ncbi:MAG: 30S ribosomal protein S2 [Candidatus Sumerlaeia bacterium]
MQPISMKQLLEAGVHFGHQKSRWNPKMRKYIYTDRNDIYIIDLKKTLKLIREACVFVRDTVANGGQGIFVGTKKQAREAIEHWAIQCNQHYVNNRWLGGVLTNWQTVGKNVKNLIDLEKMNETGEIEKYSKKEQSQLNHRMMSLKKNLDGLKNMNKLPDFIFIVDPLKEHIAVHEAKRLGIPVVAVADTNCDPDPIDHIIPGNDDAIRAINLVCQKMAEACIDGMISRVDAGLEAPSYLPEAVRQQLMGTSPEDQAEEAAEEEAPAEEAPAEVEQNVTPPAPPSPPSPSA